jgi:hypothetical protein
MHGTAMVLGAAVDMRRRRNGLAAHRRAAKRRVQAGVLVRDGDELGCLAALRLRLCDRFLVEADFGAGREKHELDTGCRHGGDDSLAIVGHRNLDPCTGLVAAVAVGVVHGFIPCSCLNDIGFDAIDHLDRWLRYCPARFVDFGSIAAT